ncbi:Cupin 2 conserved barrel domain protein [Xylanimonas cellulosilytica DSM 15894]|uniref:Cupin 2 conserved barrel domain protein n=1 Tax=Xylanimonas cellulosilytica (strain DSM 15894 / JCM 12276 / CECT 5975 / KCTC 9989 / LMG 20990 / NBRC 107835 / XIL07) TaxID=446471 RepID=D1BUV1_XYLCX|nr:cupin domain-containing protein [Xylanimonas cellulosilytica]ACZ29342.1 Cupin 2 conserved barrel domain protein [Xylanimonas cellulosilytica DSM 15894]
MSQTPTQAALKNLSVQRGDDLAQAPGQTRHARRISGVSKENTEVTDLWFGKVYTGPGEVSDPHHHGEAETGGYVFKGHGFIRFGERYEEIVYLAEGDFVYVPPFVPHIEGNLSRTEELVWMTTRTPDNIVVNLTDQDVADIEIAYVD